MINATKKGGVVGDLVSGVGGLIVLVIITLVIVATILGASLLNSANSVTSQTTTNESGAWINSTTYYLGGTGSSNASRSNYVITGAMNDTEVVIVVTGNITLDSTTGAVTNASDDWDNVQFNYTYTQTIVDDQYQLTVDDMSTNFTTGLNNISEKIPTILLISAVVLLFGVLVLLVRQAGLMGIGSSNASL